VNRAYYFAVIAEFRAASTDEILGRMARHHEFDLVEGQRNAWLEQISILKRALESHRGSIYLEFVIPRMGRRIDAVVIIGPILLVIEFKVYRDAFEVHDLDQVVDYALDLHNFHEGSHRLHIAPVLVCTAAPPEAEFIPGTLPVDGLFGPSKVNGEGLCRAITQLLRVVQGDEIAIDIWEGSGYRPTPTIIEATLALYRGHSVADIARSDAGAENLNRTSQSVAQIIETSRARSEKAICFVTGVPGSGKTLVGLEIYLSCEA
jgi:hypothetical protein